MADCMVLAVTAPRRRRGRGGGGRGRARRTLGGRPRGRRGRTLGGAVARRPRDLRCPDTRSSSRSRTSKAVSDGAVGATGRAWSTCRSTAPRSASTRCRRRGSATRWASTRRCAPSTLPTRTVPRTRFASGRPSSGSGTSCRPSTRRSSGPSSARGPTRPDDLFIVDRVGDVVVACGDSGQGFKFLPMFGQVLANLVDESADAGRRRCRRRVPRARALRRSFGAVTIARVSP